MKYCLNEQKDENKWSAYQKQSQLRGCKLMCFIVALYVELLTWNDLQSPLNCLVNDFMVDMFLRVWHEC